MSWRWCSSCRCLFALYCYDYKEYIWLISEPDSWNVNYQCMEYIKRMWIIDFWVYFRSLLPLFLNSYRVTLFQVIHQSRHNVSGGLCSWSHGAKSAAMDRLVRLIHLKQCQYHSHPSIHFSLYSTEQLLLIYSCSHIFPLWFHNIITNMSFIYNSTRFVKCNPSLLHITCFQLLYLVKLLFVFWFHSRDLHIVRAMCALINRIYIV